MKNKSLPEDLSPLFRLASVLSVVMLGLILLQMLFYVIYPPPETAEGFFALFEKSPLLGLISLDFLYLFNNLIVAVLYLALFFLHYHEKPVPMILGLFFGVIGVACYYPSNPSFEMWTLSRQFTQGVQGERILYLSAGEGLLAGYSGTAFNAYYVLSTLCLLLFSYVLLKSPKVKKAMGMVAMASGVLMIIPSSAGSIGLVFSLLSLIPWMIFVIMLVPYFYRAATLNNLAKKDQMTAT